MLCRNPFMQDGLGFGCGQCMQCRINRRNHWANRLMLESASHEFNTFVTLTYDDENLPSNCNCPKCKGKHLTGTLRPSDVTKFLMRLRTALREVNRVFRFYMVGEYGDLNFRPHYHLMMFGISTLDLQLISNKWNKGIVHVGDCNKDTAAYTAGYVTKKMTKSTDPRLEGRHPEYSRMSNRPGIGAFAADDIGDQLTTKEGSYAIQLNNGEIPQSLIISSKRQPIHRYLKKRIRQRVGLPELGVNSPACQAARLRLQDLLGAEEMPTLQAKKQALINKTEHLANRRLKLQQIYASSKKGRTL